MALGMTPHEFWNGDPNAVMPYRAMYRKKLEYDNFVAYLHGLYAHQAFSAVEATVNRRKGAKPTPYMKEPVQINADSPLEKEIKRLTAEVAEQNRLKTLRDDYENNRAEMEYEDLLEAELLFGEE